ncbi:BTAD domain-containing putative transcriptional regulator [Egicoccus sp. AB-alg2]|uniref:BTAD domain-containing putative transcriptional regulator n=1 Tax=Egicoccus sp. AB-alg2 TaxID=3242693 RepID=UPI00359D9081
MQFGVLGPLSLVRDGATIDVTTPKQRALLTHLLVQARRPVPIEQLVAGLWGEQPPAQALVSLRSYVSNLRRTLDGTGVTIASRNRGYLLDADPDAVDHVRFERLLATGRGHLRAGDPAAALGALDAALALWRGDVFADAADNELLRGDAVRLDELRRGAHEDRMEALLQLGRPEEVVAAATDFVLREPLRERARGQLMLALYRTGRGPDALEAFHGFRSLLADELGLDPSPHLQRLADDILRQEPELSRERDGAATPPAAPPVAAPIAGPDAPPTRLAGRVHERTELRSSLERMTAGTGSVLLVVGEPGIGKTTLLEGMVEDAVALGAVAAWGRCPETPGAPAFWPWVQALRTLADAVDDPTLSQLVAGEASALAHLVPTIADRTGAAPGDLAGHAEARFVLFDAVDLFLRRFTAARPLLVVIDDLHWADEPSLQLLGYLAPHVGDRRLVLAASYRDVVADWSPTLQATLAELVRAPTLQQLGLAGLLPADVARVVADRTGQVLPVEELLRLHERTGGNPFFVHQLAQLRRESSDPDGVPTSEALPAGVRHVLARRLSALPDQTRTLLEAAALAGRDIDPAVVGPIVGGDTAGVLERLEPAVAHGLVERTGPVTAHRFVHALVRECLVDAVPPARRLRLHRELGAALEATGRAPASAVAEHYWRAADLIDDDRPVRQLLLAAAEARAVLAHEQAERYLRRARELTAARGDAAGELEVLLALLSLLTTTHGWIATEIVEVVERALDLARDGDIDGQTHVGLWWSLWTYHQNRADFDRALAVAAEVPAVGSAQRLADLAGAVMRASTGLDTGLDPEVAVDTFTRVARELAEWRAPEATGRRGSAGAGVRRLDGFGATLTVVVHCLLGEAEAMRGNTGPALAAARTAQRLAADTDDLFAFAWAALLSGWTGIVADDPEFVLEIAEPAIEVATRHGFGLARDMLTVSANWARARIDGDAAARAADMRAGVEAILATGVRYAQPQYLLFTAETFLLAGALDDARDCLWQAVALAAETAEALPAERLRRLQGTLGTPPTVPAA